MELTLSRRQHHSAPGFGQERAELSYWEADAYCAFDGSRDAAEQLKPEGPVLENDGFSC